MSEHKEYWPSEDPSLDRYTYASGPAGPGRKIDPLTVTPSALAHGQIGRVPWALVERGDGLILAIGSINVPVDTPAEAKQACKLGYMLYEKSAQAFQGSGDPK